MALLDELIVRIGMDSSGVDQGADEVTSKMDGLAAPAAAAGLAAGAVFAVGISSAMDISSAQSQLQDQLGLTEQEAARAGGIAGDVFSAGFGGSLEEVATSVGSVVSSIGELGDFTDAELEGMSKAALGLAKRFEFDIGESTAAVGNLIKGGMVKDGVEGFDLLTAAAQKMPKKLREEIPTLTNEYGDFFNQLGFTGPDMFGLLAEAAKNPVFEIDKVGDAIKELSLRLADTDAAREPLKDLGLDIDSIQKLMDTGKGTEAFDQIITALKGVDNQTERTMLQAALFGGPGEDMGNTLLKLDAGGAAAASGMSKAAGASKALTDGMEDDPAQQMDAAMRTLTQGLGEALLPILLKASEFFSEHKGLMETLVPIVLGLAVALGIMAAVIWLVNIAMLANPVAWIILGIVALIAVIVLVIAKWDEIAAAVGRAWDWMMDKVQEGSDWINNKIRTVLDWISDKWSEAWGWITDKTGTAVDAVMDAIGWLGRIPGNVSRWLGEAVDYVTALPGRIARAASGMWDGIKNSFKDALNWVIWKWNNFSLTLGGGSVLGVNVPSITLNTPDIPYLAEGGVTTGPTLAMIGEGREDEAVLPLSKLDQMINMGGSMRAPSVSKVDRFEVIVTSRVDAGAFQDAFQHEVRTKAGSSVSRYAGEDND